MRFSTRVLRRYWWASVCALLGAACNPTECIRHSDCPAPLICSEYGQCTVRPVDAGDDAAMDAGAADQSMPDLAPPSRDDGGVVVVTPAADMTNVADLLPASVDLTPASVDMTIARVDQAAPVDLLTSVPADLGSPDLPKIGGVITFSRSLLLTVRPLWRTDVDAGVN